ncbi:MAG TPA: sigma-70 family RNA polymerase sigma factor [Steroidobacteraceae bacterium]|nr:sigma-70 family RNA polymerase sigma factor [Steroidobacteraceae bacterium]
MSESVLAGVARGDGPAMRECMERFGGLVWAIARRMTRSRADAEDAVQEVFVDVWRSAARYDPAQGTERVFIATIARRRLIDRIRRGRLMQYTSDESVLEDVRFAEPGNHGEVRVEAERAARAVARLRPQQQRILRMGLLEGMTHSEIASATGLPLGTVKTLMRRGLIQAREWLGVDAAVARSAAGLHCAAG